MLSFTAMRHTTPTFRAFARAAATLTLMISIAACASSGTPASVTPTPVVQQADEGPPLTRAEILLGEYRRYRANNDLLYYHLDIRLDPDRKFLSGKNTIRFRMLSDDDRIQIDLHQALNVDSILLGRTPLKYTREERAVFIDFPETLEKGRTASIDFYYSGTPAETGRRGAGGGGGGVTFRTDANGKPFINTVCEGTGSSTWWPSKDQWHDEVESADISVAVPNGLTDVSNGVFVGKTDLGDGYTRWDWAVHYPINSYSISMNVGDYVHFTDTYEDMTLNFYVLRDSLAKAKAQFTQAKGLLAAYEHFFGEYPFRRTATSSSRPATPAWSTRAPSPTATASRMATVAETGLVSVSARASTSSSSTRADTNGSATPSRLRTGPTCGSTRAGRRIWKACT